MAMDDALVPGADAAEQDPVVEEDAPEREPVESVGERPEADVLEQAAVVRTEQDIRMPNRRHDVPEADAWEQSIEEPLEDDRY
jgi:hypothetical protein